MKPILLLAVTTLFLGACDDMMKKDDAMTKAAEPAMASDTAEKADAMMDTAMEAEKMATDAMDTADKMTGG